MTTTSSNLAGPVAERIAALRAEREAELAEAERKRQAQMAEHNRRITELVHSLLGDLANHAVIAFNPELGDMTGICIEFVGLPPIDGRIDFLASRITWLAVGDKLFKNTTAIVRDEIAERQMLDAALLAAADLAGEER